MEDRIRGVQGYWIGAAVLIGIGAMFSLFFEKGTFLVWLAHHRNPFLDYYFYWITKACEPIAYFIVALLVLISSWKKMVMVPLAGSLTSLLTYLLKTYFNHERPALYLERLKWAGPMDVLGYHALSDHTSFPSGHSMAAWTLFSLIAMLYRKTWVSILCLFLAVSVSTSRIYLMAHFLQDVVFGAGIGCLIAYGVYSLYLFWMRKQP